MSDQSAQLNMEHLWSQKKLEKGRENVHNQEFHKFDGTIEHNELDRFAIKSCNRSYPNYNDIVNNIFISFVPF